MNRTLRPLAFVRLTLLFSLVAFSLFAAATDPLKYVLTAKPGDLTVDQMPGPSPKSYSEEFTFTVTNPTRTDSHGTAPTTKIYDVEVFFVAVDKPMSVWKWSKGKVFGQLVTPVSIPAGQSWQPDQKIVWNFKANEVKQGKYFAVATFAPTGNKTAKADFTITTVQ